MIPNWQCSVETLDAAYAQRAIHQLSYTRTYSHATKAAPTLVGKCPLRCRGGYPPRAAQTFRQLGSSRGRANQRVARHSFVMMDCYDVGLSASQLRARQPPSLQAILELHRDDYS
jgi:hypothetical protein